MKAIVLRPLIIAAFFFLTVAAVSGQTEEVSADTPESVAIIPAVGTDSIPLFVPSVLTTIISNNLILPLAYEPVVSEESLSDTLKDRMRSEDPAAVAGEVAKDSTWNWFILLRIEGTEEDLYNIDAVLVNGESGSVSASVSVEDQTLESFRTAASNITRSLVKEGLPQGRQLVKEQEQREKEDELEAERRERIVDSIIKDGQTMDPSEIPYLGSDKEEIKRQVSTAGFSFLPYLAWTAGSIGNSVGLAGLYFDTSFGEASRLVHEYYQTLPAGSSQENLDNLYATSVQLGQFSYYSRIAGLAGYGADALLSSTLGIFGNRSRIYVSGFGRVLLGTGSLMKSGARFLWYNGQIAQYNQYFTRLYYNSNDFNPVPDLSSEVVASMLFAGGATGLDIIAPLIGGRRQPLFASNFTKLLYGFGSILSSGGNIVSRWTSEYLIDSQRYQVLYDSLDSSSSGEEFDYVYTKYSEAYDSYYLFKTITIGLWAAGGLMQFTALAVPPGKNASVVKRELSNKPALVSFTVDPYRSSASVLVRF